MKSVKNFLHALCVCFHNNNSNLHHAIKQNLYTTSSYGVNGRFLGYSAQLLQLRRNVKRFLMSDKAWQLISELKDRK